MKKILVIFLLAFCSSFIYAKDLTVSIGAGSNYKEKRNPQIAIWITDSKGTIVKTLYVTERAAKKNWICSPKKGRPESLPVWYFCANRNNRSLIENKSYKKADNENIDAVTSATPKGGLIYRTSFDFEPGKEYFIYAELNNSFDYNQFFTKKNSGVNGQPSIIYGAPLNSNNSGEIKLLLLGTGSIDGTDGDIHHDEKKLSTAKNIASLIVVELN